MGLTPSSLRQGVSDPSSRSRVTLSIEEAARCAAAQGSARRARQALRAPPGGAHPPARLLQLDFVNVWYLRTICAFSRSDLRPRRARPRRTAAPFTNSGARGVDHPWSMAAAAAPARHAHRAAWASTRSCAAPPLRDTAIAPFVKEDPQSADLPDRHTRTRLPDRGTAPCPGRARGVLRRASWRHGPRENFSRVFDLAERVIPREHYIATSTGTNPAQLLRIAAVRAASRRQPTWRLLPDEGRRARPASTNC